MGTSAYASDPAKDKDYIAGKACYERQDYDKARYHLLRVHRENPDHEQTLLMLANIEERTKHYATAIVHLNELLALNPYNENFWRKKIGIYRLQGNHVEADRLLDRLCTIYPENEDLQKQRRARQQEVFNSNYRKQCEQGDIEGQITSLRAMIAQGQVTGDRSKGEVSELCFTLSSRLQQVGRISESLDALSQGLILTPGNMMLIRKKAGILAEQGRTMEAYTFIKNLGVRNGETEKMLRDLEETLLLQAELNDPYVMNGKRWEQHRDKEALRYLVSTSITRGYLEDARFYLKESCKIYGETPELLYKSYTVEKRLGNTPQAFQFLHKLHQKQPGNEEVTDILAAEALRNATSLIADENYAAALPLLDSVIAMHPDEEIVVSAQNKRRAINGHYAEVQLKQRLEEWHTLVPQLMEEKQYMEAITIADSILLYEPKDEMMPFYKGTAYEHLHEWDKAYECLKRYNPSPLELGEHRRHLNELLARKMKNTLGIDYQQARLGLEDKLTANASISYDRKLRNNDVLSTSILYTARDYALGEEGNDENEAQIIDKGGVGIQLNANYRHIFSERFAGELGAAWASKYFPVVTVKAVADWTLRKDWGIAVRASYRRTDSSHITNDDVITNGSHSDIFNLGATVTKNLDKWHFAMGTDGFLISGHFYASVNGKMQYFPLEHSKTHVFAAAGCGSAPELEIIDNSLPTGFSHLNTFVAAGGFVSLTRHLGLAASGSWYNLVNTHKLHRNYFYINAHIQITF